MESLLTFETLIAFLTLCALELVLGIDNIIFISIISDRLPKNSRKLARTLGLSLAVLSRIALLLSLSWVMSLTKPILTIYHLELSGRDLILILGGLFLIAKSTHEIHKKMEDEEEIKEAVITNSFGFVIVQILLLDIIFSLDSVITAVGMVNDIRIMIAAIIVSTIIMIAAAGSLADFVDKHPTFKVLALSFLVLIGVALIAEGFDTHIPKGYIYFAMVYAIIVELINMKLRQKRKSKSIKQ